MIASTDYVGLAAVISATAAAIVSIIVALRQAAVKSQVDTVKSQVDEVHAAVSMTNGGTLGGVVEKIDRATEPDS